MSIEEKIDHWRRVFRYAEGRGIEIYFFCWNLLYQVSTVSALT